MQFSELRRMMSPERFIDAETEGEHRSCFQADIDRIAFSTAFRLLADKTQVHGPSGTVYTRSRLTHSIEVSRIAKSLGNLFTRCFEQWQDDESPEDVQVILQATGLLHDIGNTPFGHTGEDCISAFFREDNFGKSLIQDLDPVERTQFTHFESNAQAFRYTKRLGGWRSDGGLCLTAATIAAFCKYPFTPDPIIGVEKRSHKYGVFFNDAHAFSDIAKACNMQNSTRSFSWRRHPLTYLSEAADDICYNIVDLEDAAQIGIITFDEAEELLLPLLTQKSRSIYQTIGDTGRQIVYLRSQAITSLVNAIGSLLPDVLHNLMDGSHPANLVNQTPFGTQIQHIKRFSRQYIYHNPARRIQDELAATAIHTIMQHTAEKLLEREKAGGPIRAYPLELMENVSKIPYDRSSWLHALCDHVVAQTDRSALDIANKLTQA